MPILRSLLICDDVIQREDSQYDVLGIKRVFTVNTLPCKGRFKVFALIDGMPSGSVKLSVRFTKESGVQLAEFQQSDFIHPEFDGHLWHIYNVFVEIMSIGQFELIYLVNDLELGRLPFAVETSMPFL